MTLNSIKNNLKFISSKFPYAMAVVAVCGFLIGRFFEVILAALAF